MHVTGPVEIRGIELIGSETKDRVSSVTCLLIHPRPGDDQRPFFERAVTGTKEDGLGIDVQLYHAIL